MMASNAAASGHPAYPSPMRNLIFLYPISSSSVFALWDPIAREFCDLVNSMDDDQLLLAPTGMNEPAWQIILHVVNHGTDHRAQLLRNLNDLGVKTESQDYIFYVYDHL